MITRECHTEGDCGVSQWWGEGRQTKLYYVGTSGLVAKEVATGDEHDTDEKRYSYDPYGGRNALEADNGTPDIYMYTYDAHGSTSLLIQDASSGSAQASYGYDAYGGTDTDLTRELKPGDSAQTSANDPLNPYRYTGKRQDTGTDSIDMGARRFSTETARFLSSDFYAGALEDLSLSTDPLTANRYALAGGNPIGYIEVDGHAPDASDVKAGWQAPVKGAQPHGQHVPGGATQPPPPPPADPDASGRSGPPPITPAHYFLLANDGYDYYHRGMNDCYEQQTTLMSDIACTPPPAGPDFNFTNNSIVCARWLCQMAATLLVPEVRAMGIVALGIRTAVPRVIATTEARLAAATYATIARYYLARIGGTIASASTRAARYSLRLAGRHPKTTIEIAYELSHLPQVKHGAEWLGDKVREIVRNIPTFPPPGAFGTHP